MLSWSKGKGVKGFVTTILKHANERGKREFNIVQNGMTSFQNHHLALNVSFPALKENAAIKIN